MTTTLSKLVRQGGRADSAIARCHVRDRQKEAPARLAQVDFACCLERHLTAGRVADLDGLSFAALHLV